MTRLFRHDRQIACNLLRATFATWPDRAAVAFVMLTGAAALHAWFVDRSWQAGAWAALALGLLCGIGTGRGVAARLAFHASDGVLAADALDPLARRRYAAAWLAVTLGLLAVLMLIARPALVGIGLAGGLAGGLVAGAVGGVPIRLRAAGATPSLRAIRAQLQRARAGLAAAALLLVSLLTAPGLGPDALRAMAAAETLLLGLALTMVDDRVVRFMAATGHGTLRILARQMAGIAAFFLVAAPGCAVLHGPVIAAIVAMVAIALALLMLLRIFAYRLHDRRFADLLVSILAGLLLLVGYAAPPALPVMAAAMVWHLERLGRQKRWLLA